MKHEKMIDGKNIFEVEFETDGEIIMVIATDIQEILNFYDRKDAIRRIERITKNAPIRVIES